MERANLHTTGDLFPPEPVAADGGGSMSWRVFRWWSTTAETQPTPVRQRLIQTTLDRKAALVVSALSVTATASTAAYVTGALWPLVWLAVDLALDAFRLTVLFRSDGASEERKEEHIAVLMGAGFLWCVVFGLGLGACVMTGDPVLSVMAAINVAGAAGAISSRNAATPRYGGLAMVLCCVPFGIGVALAGRPEMLVVAMLVPLWVAGMYVIMLQNHDVAVRMIRAELTTRRLARTDMLTGLANRIFVEERLAALCTACEQRGAAAAFAVLCLDLDGFKAVNDHHGHGAGDRLLKTVALRLAHALREQDYACRMGGDEFVAILPGASSDEAAFVGRRIIASISRPFDIGVDELVRIGASIGSALAPEHGARPDDLLSRADQALYLAKHAGKGVYRTAGTG